MRKNILFLCFISFIITACKDNQHFKVVGTVENNINNETLYLEHIGLDKVNVIDSVQLKKNGHYHFKMQRPATPDFYRIRIKNNFVVFSVDSTETVTITSTDPSFSDNYSIRGSESINKISTLRRSAKNLEKIIAEYNKIDPASDSIFAKQEELNEAIENHKKLARQIIFEDTRSTAAYYAVFQKVNNMYIFDPFNDDDLKAYAAVATAYNAFYPHSLRGKHLTNLVLQTKKTKRAQENRHNLEMMMQDNEVGLIDINLPDKNGKNIRLSDLKGKVVLVDFCYLKIDHSVEHVFAMRDLYQKYNKQGFEIYGISFDGDFEYFKSSSENLPWTRVYDEDGLNSTLLRLYNIDKLPTMFLVDKKSNIVARYTSVGNDLIRNIEKLLKE